MKQQLERNVCRRAGTMGQAQQVALRAYMVMFGLLLSSCFVCAIGQVQEVKYTVNISNIPNPLEVTLLQQSSDDGKPIIKLEFVKTGDDKWNATFPNKPDDIEIRYKEGDRDKSSKDGPFPFRKNLPLEITIAKMDEKGLTVDYQISSDDASQTKNGKIVFRLPVKAANLETNAQPVAAKSLKDVSVQLESYGTLASWLVYLSAFTLLVGLTSWLTVNFIAWRRLKDIKKHGPTGIEKVELREIIGNELEEKLKRPPAELLEQVKNQFPDSSRLTEALNNPPASFVAKIKEATAQNADYDKRVQRFVSELRGSELMLTSEKTLRRIEASIERLRGSGRDDKTTELVSFDTPAVKSELDWLKNDLSGMREITKNLVTQLQHALKQLLGATAFHNLATLALPPVDSTTQSASSVVAESVPVEVIDDAVPVEIGLEVKVNELLPLIQEEERKVSERMAALEAYVDALKMLNSEYARCDGYLNSGKGEYKDYLDSLDGTTDEAKLRHGSQAKLDWFNRNPVKHILDISWKELKPEGNSPLDRTFIQLLSALELKHLWPIKGHAFAENQQEDVSESQPPEYEHAQCQIIKEVLSPCVYEDEQNIIVKARVKTG